MKTTKMIKTIGIMVIGAIFATATNAASFNWKDVQGYGGPGTAVQRGNPIIVLECKPTHHMTSEMFLPEVIKNGKPIQVRLGITSDDMRVAGILDGERFNVDRFRTEYDLQKNTSFYKIYTNNWIWAVDKAALDGKKYTEITKVSQDETEMFLYKCAKVK